MKPTPSAELEPVRHDVVVYDPDFLVGMAAVQSCLEVSRHKELMARDEPVFRGRWLQGKMDNNIRQMNRAEEAWREYNDRYIALADRNIDFISQARNAFAVLDQTRRESFDLAADRFATRELHRQYETWQEDAILIRTRGCLGSLSMRLGFGRGSQLQLGWTDWLLETTSPQQANKLLMWYNLYARELERAPEVQAARDFVLQNFKAGLQAGIESRHINPSAEHYLVSDQLEQVVLPTGNHIYADETGGLVIPHFYPDVPRHENDASGAATAADFIIRNGPDVLARAAFGQDTVWWVREMMTDQIGGMVRQCNWGRAPADVRFSELRNLYAAYSEAPGVATFYEQLYHYTDVSDRTSRGTELETRGVRTPPDLNTRHLQAITWRLGQHLKKSIGATQPHDPTIQVNAVEAAAAKTSDEWRNPKKQMKILRGYRAEQARPRAAASRRGRQKECVNKKEPLRTRLFKMPRR